MKARVIENSDIAFAPPHVREVFDWLIRQANHADNKVCNRGQCIRRMRDIQDGLRWYVGFIVKTYKKDSIEKALSWLRKRVMIATTRTTWGMRITICNYDTYQTPGNYESNNENVYKATMKGKIADTINKNDKNDKECREERKPENTGCDVHEKMKGKPGHLPHYCRLRYGRGWCINDKKKCLALLNIIKAELTAAKVPEDKWHGAFTNRINFHLNNRAEEVSASVKEARK